MRKQLRQKTRKNARAHNCGGSQPPNVLPIRSTKLVKANTTAAVACPLRREDNRRTPATGEACASGTPTRKFFLFAGRGGWALFGSY